MKKKLPYLIIFPTSAKDKGTKVWNEVCIWGHALNLPWTSWIAWMYQLKTAYSVSVSITAAAVSTFSTGGTNIASKLVVSVYVKYIATNGCGGVYLYLYFFPIKMFLVATCIRKQSITENCLSYGDLSEQEQKMWPLLPDSQNSGVLNYS